MLYIAELLVIAVFMTFAHSVMRKNWSAMRKSVKTAA
jgi:hypothetical protein